MGAAKPLLGVVGKEQEPDVAWGVVPVDAGGDLHAAIDFPRIRLVEQTAADICQKFPDFCLADLLDRHSQSAAVVKRNSCCELNELCEDRALGLDRVAADPYVVFPGGFFQSFGRLMGASVAPRSPDDEDVFSFDDLGEKIG